MHLSLNNLLVTRQLLGQSRHNLQKMPEFHQPEFDKISEGLETQEKQDAFKREYEQISAEIASYIDFPFDTTYTGGSKVSQGEVDALDSLLLAEELISPLRKSSVHTLVSQFLGTLMLSVLYAFPSLMMIRFHSIETTGYSY